MFFVFSAGAWECTARAQKGQAAPALGPRRDAASDPALIIPCYYLLFLVIPYYSRLFIIIPDYSLLFPIIHYYCYLL